MQVRRWAGFCAVTMLAAGFVGIPVGTSEPTQAEQKQDIWEDEPRESRSWWRRGLSDEMIDKVMEGLRKRDPARAKELNRLRRTDPERFKIELREHGRPELDRIVRDYWEARRQRRNAEFLGWLKDNYPKEEQNLATLKARDPQFYVAGFEHAMDQYGRIFEADRSNPEFGKVLKEDLRLKDRRDDLVRQIHAERSEAKRQALGVELQEVVGRRYDLIVRRKQIAYEDLLKRLKALQKQVTDSRDEIVKWQDDRLKRENIRQRIRDLTGKKGKFKWD
jgi:hypothetical protein